MGTQDTPDIETIRAAVAGEAWALEALLAAYHQLTQRKNEVGFQRKGVVVLAVIEVYIHRVHILAAGGRNAHHLSVKPLHKGVIFRFRVADNNIVVGNEESVCHFPLCRKALAAAGSAED